MTIAKMILENGAEIVLDHDDVRCFVDSLNFDDDAFTYDDESNEVAVKYVIDANCGHIVYENVNGKFVKIDDFV